VPATLALTAGVGFKVVSEQLGHTTTQITRDIYLSVMPQVGHADEAAAALVPRAAETPDVTEGVHTLCTPADIPDTRKRSLQRQRSRSDRFPGVGLPVGVGHERGGGVERLSRCHPREPQAQRQVRLEPLQAVEKQHTHGRQREQGTGVRRPALIGRGVHAHRPVDDPLRAGVVLALVVSKIGASAVYDRHTLRGAGVGMAIQVLLRPR
jgi:hypothetical protein